MRHLVFLLSAMLAVLSLAGRAAEPASLALGSTTDLTNVGVHLRVVRDYTNRPWPAASAVTYENVQTKATVETYLPLDLWRQEQACALFLGETGRVTVALARYLPPADLPLINGQHVRLADYRKQAEQAPPLAKADDLQPWVEAFAGHPVAATSDKVKDLQSRFPYRRFTFTGKDADHYQAYALLVAREPQLTYVVLVFDLAEGLSARTAAGAIDHMVESVTYAPVRPVDKAAANVSPVVHGGVAPAARSPEYEATRQRVIQNLANLKEWWYVELPDYVIATDLERRDRRLVERLQNDLQQLRPAYAALVPPRVPIAEVSVVRIFRTKQEYTDYLPPELGWTAGVWMPGKKELALAPLVDNDPTLQLKRLLDTAYHEAFHQYLYYALDRNWLPPWYNEGLATFIEAAEIDANRKRIEVRENTLRVATINRLVAGKQRLHAAAVMAMDYPEYYQKDSAEENYATGYAITYFLRKAAWLYPGQGYETLSDTVEDTVITWKADRTAVLAAVTKAVNLAKLEADLNDFWSSPVKRKKAEAYDPFPKKDKAPPVK